jgi:hypothetical protein
MSDILTAAELTAIRERHLHRQGGVGATWGQTERLLWHIDAQAKRISELEAKVSRLSPLKLLEH